MKKQLLHTPEGVRDIYNEECEKKLLLQSDLLGILKGYGYHPIQTPTFEFFDIFGKFADFFGPMIMSFCALVLGSSTYGILGLLLLFVVGYVLLRKIPENQEK